MYKKTNRLITVALIIISFSFPELQAQIITGKDKGAEDLFTARVKQFGEFSARFNNSQDFNGNPSDSIFRNRMPREKMLSLLFDLNDPRANPQNKSYSPDFIKIKTEFISEISKGGLELERYSPGVIAEARSRIIYNGKPVTTSIFLNQEVENNGLKWVILSVADLFNEEFKQDSSLMRFIQPASNETDFINLQRALRDTGYLQEYAYKDFKPDNLSIFLYCLNTGVIQFEYTEEVIYHIISIPGWYFKVRDFNRNELNSGWLITDLARGNFKTEDFR